MQGGDLGGADHADEASVTFMAKAELLAGVAEIDALDRRRTQTPQASGLGHTSTQNLDEAR